MARPAIPNALDMTRLKYGPEAAFEAKDQVAALLRAADRRFEAMLLYDGRPEHPSLQEDLRWALETGSSFMLFSLRRLGVTVTDEQRRTCAEAAEAHGRWYDAHRLYEVLGDAAALERVRAQIPSFKVAIPDNKKDEPLPGTAPLGI